MIIVDTSAWVDFFRGKGPLAERVDALLDADEVALCGPVIAELRRGLRPGERRQVLSHLGGCHLLEQPADLWVEAGELGFILARQGISAKTLDLLIAAYALAHATPLLTADPDFRRMRAAGIPLLLIDA